MLFSLCFLGSGSEPPYKQLPTFSSSLCLQRKQPFNTTLKIANELLNIVVLFCSGKISVTGECAGLMEWTGPPPRFGGCPDRRGMTALCML